MKLPLELLHWAAAGLLAAAALVFWFGVLVAPESAPHRYFSLYVAYLERKLRNMFVMTPGKSIAITQLATFGVALSAGLYFSSPLGYAVAALAAGLPPLWIELMRRKRVQRIEERLDQFVLSLANALKATPSLGNALTYTQPLLDGPLHDEVGLALKEMRLGTSLDQALLNMAGRIQSVQLDAALSGLLIGRQVGGDLPKILETTATTLREMARLKGVVRTKTAEGKAQLWVLAVFPAVILFLFDTIRPGYFEPLGGSWGGRSVVVIAIVLWVTSLALARKVLAVQL